MPVTSATTLCGLRILSPREAAAEGFAAITTNISQKTEAKILSSISAGRDPNRTVFIATGPMVYQLAILRVDVSDLKDRTVLGF